jgi:hypothetical protein
LSVTGRGSVLDGTEGGIEDWRRSPPTLLRRWPVLCETCLAVAEGGVAGTRFSRPTRGIIDTRPRGGRTLGLLGARLFGSTDFLRLPSWFTLTDPSVWRRLLLLGRCILAFEDQF